MPTQISPDDPNATGAGRLQAMVGGRDPGMPSVAGRPAPGAGRFSFPAPPAPATSPVGKPPDGARAAMVGGGPTSPKPGVPAPGAAPAPAATPSSAATSPPATPGSTQPASGAGSSVTGGVAAPAAPAPPTVDANGQATQTFASATIPKPGTLVPGTSVQTPYGTASMAPDGTQRLALDAAGAQKYKESVAALRSKFQLPRVMKGLSGLPQMDLKLGAHNFDPFTGRYHGKE